MKTQAKLKRSDRYSHYCPICTSCQSGDEETCTECGTTVPQQGWPPLEGSPFPFLGMELDERYVFRQFLGDGATGYVYRAQALQIYRDFAAKLVDTKRYGRKDFQQELLRRFKMEVEAMSRLHNPHVVAIYEAMELNDHLFVLLMDYVDGRTLQKLLERVGRVKLERALDIARQIANGLFEAHALGFIHRDLKPDNIMIERLPAAGFFARILDFGIVHMMDDTSATQGFRGTPLYASPEQCVGDPNIDHRADIYGLGCVLFHCITGKPPFPGTESLKVMDAHVRQAPPLVRDLLPDTRATQKLDDLLQSMLAKNPADRPSDMSMVIQEIDRVVEEQKRPALAEPTNPDEPGMVVNELANVQFSNRFETADFPVATMEEVSAASSQIVRPVIEFSIPGTQPELHHSYTAAGLVAQGELALLVEQQEVSVVGMRNDGFFETFNSTNQMMITAVDLDRTRSNVYGADLNGDIWRFSFGRPAAKVGTLPDRIYAMSVDLNEIVCGTDKGRVVVMDAVSGRARELVGSGPPIAACAISDKNRSIMVGGWDKSIRLIKLSDATETTLEPLESNARSVVVSSDGMMGAALDDAGNVRIYNLQDTSSFFDLAVGDKHLRAIEFANDGMLLGLRVHKNMLRLSDFRNRAISLQVSSQSSVVDEISETDGQ